MASARQRGTWNIYSHCSNTEWPPVARKPVLSYTGHANTSDHMPGVCLREEYHILPGGGFGGASGNTLMAASRAGRHHGRIVPGTTRATSRPVRLHARASIHAEPVRHRFQSLWLCAMAARQTLRAAMPGITPRLISADRICRSLQTSREMPRIEHMRMRDRSPRTRRTSRSLCPETAAMIGLRKRSTCCKAHLGLAQQRSVLCRIVWERRRIVILTTPFMSAPAAKGFVTCRLG